MKLLIESDEIPLHNATSNNSAVPLPKWKILQTHVVKLRLDLVSVFTLSERNQVVNTTKITCIHAMKERNAGNYTSLHRFLFFGHMTLRSEIFAKGRFVRFKAIG